MSSINRKDSKRLPEGGNFRRRLEQLAETEEFDGLLAREFPSFEALWQAPINRRDTLKLMAASLALGGLAGCSGQPPEQIVPYVNMPEYLIPGKPQYYATASLIGGYAHGLLAESHEGRPTKVEGNPQHPATLGACDVCSQASVLSLYDPDRSSAVMRRGSIASYGALLVALQNRQQRWDANAGQGLCILTETITSPSEQALLQALLKRWPQARWYAHEPVDRSAVYAASRLLFGRPLEPVYRLSQARVVVSLDADFMQSQPGFLRYARDLMAQRRPRDVGTALARLYTVESTPSITGAVADHSQRIPYHAIEALARQLAAAMGLDVAAPQTAVAQPWVDALAKDLLQNRQRAVVIPGDQQPPAVHALAHAINQALDAYGHTLYLIEPVAVTHAVQGLPELTSRIHAGQVDSLAVLSANPVYTAPADLDFAAAYQRIPWRLHWGAYYNETGRLSHWHVPATHPLEAWADARAYDGTVSLIQPLIQVLNNGKTALQMLTALTQGIDQDAHQLLKDYWQHRQGGPEFEASWRRSLQAGIVAHTQPPPQQIQLRPDWAAKLPAPQTGTNTLTLQFRPDPTLWDGRYANNAWLQELPRPLTKLCWDNALLVSPALAEQRGLAEGDIVKLTADDRTLEVPVYILPGQPAAAVTLNLGHGRVNAGGHIAEGMGSNAYTLRLSTSPWARPIELSRTGQNRTLAITQRHASLEGRKLMRAADVAEYRKDPHFAQESQPDVSLYPEPWPAPRTARHAWGMVVDLSACIGCTACVIACQAENNIPVVGPSEVSRGHDMYWIRVDRYFDGPLKGPEMVFQPVPCMQCENAPCEYVCPVEATQHSAEGINEMVYQRCVGTRYCSQNCPYKVRRFNWFDYTGGPAKYPAPWAVQNPDVTVRTRGVMEKCTYCIQRINAARYAADIKNRPIAPGELQTACQQACPTEAIVFGDLMEESSEVRKLKAHPLNYAMLAELNTRPRTTYLAAVRNRNPQIKEEEG